MFRWPEKPSGNFKESGVSMDNLVINREMARRARRGYEECLEVGMSPAQKEVFLIVDACDDGFGLVDTSNYPSRQGSWNHV